MNQSTAKWVLRILVAVVVGAFLSFLTLKLCGLLPWSWWAVTSPIWVAALVLVLLFGLSFLIVMAFASLTFSGKHSRKSKQR